MRLLPCVFVATFIASLPLSSSHANRSSHERIDIKEVKKGGKVVGMKVEMLLKPYGDAHKYVRIGIASGTKVEKHQASDKSALVHMKEITLKKPGQPEKQSVTVLYDEHFKPGSRFVVSTAWHSNKNPASAWHVWGYMGRAPVQTAPGSAAAKRLGAVHRIKRERSRSRPKMKPGARSRSQKPPARTSQRARIRRR